MAQTDNGKQSNFLASILVTEPTDQDGASQNLCMEYLQQSTCFVSLSCPSLAHKSCVKVPLVLGCHGEVERKDHVACT